MRTEAIYKGATRPAMKFGIPLVPLVVLFGIGMLLSLWGGLFIGGWVVGMVVAAFAPALAWMRFTTRREDQRFRQMVIAARLGLLDKNTRLWRARSYSPTRFKGVKDAWHT